MRVLLLTHSFNSLAQRLFVVLRETGHQVSVEFDIHDRVTEEAVVLFRPDLVIAPFLKRLIPESVWRRVPCLVVHPGIEGDRGPSSLDWAILEGEDTWGVTLIQANAILDDGDVWEARTFPMRPGTKSSLYRSEATRCAEAAVLAAIDRFAGGTVWPRRPGAGGPGVRGRLRPPMRQADRAIDWSADDSATVLRKIHSGDGRPGVQSAILGLPVWLFDAHDASDVPVPPGTEPGTVIGRRLQAVAVATVDGAVWIGHLRPRIEGEATFKLPAALVLGDRLAHVPVVAESTKRGWHEISYEEAKEDGVGVLHFPFYNGAMSTEQARRLEFAFLRAAGRDVRVIVLMGGPDFWSNGMHLGVIEAAHSPADESWRNIQAIDDLVLAILKATDRYVIAALQGNGGAGGVFLALAADEVIARDGIVLNPHYKNMGNLFGSEYWTYLLPRRCGQDRAQVITEARLPMGPAEALRLGLIERMIGGDGAAFRRQVLDRARDLARDPALPALLRAKAERLGRDEAVRPLNAYREDELDRMHRNFYGFDPSYHVARSNFIHAVPKSRTPLTIAGHRRGAFA
jgi:putative two-component system hydrogenase maturation factor HypX/HoxX